MTLEAGCFAADTFAMGTQVGTLYPSDNAFACAAACVENPDCFYWNDMSDSNYCVMFDASGPSSTMETAGMFFGSKECEAGSSPVCAQCGACVA